MTMYLGSEKGEISHSQRSGKSRELDNRKTIKERLI